MPRPRVLLLFLPALLLMSCVRAPLAAEKADGEVAEKAGDKGPAGMTGGSLGRNLVNLVDKDIAADFAVRPKGKEKNVKWAAALGTVAYGGPVVAGGKIYVGTNNGKPRDHAVEDDRGVLMCFNEADGKLLWQHTYEKLDEGQDVLPTQGIASTPWVEGDRLWYVNNRAEFVCSDTSGKVVWKYDMIKELDIYVGQLAYTSPLVVGDLVYGLTSNGVDAGTGKLPKPKAPSLVALHKKTGKFAWSNALPGANVMRGQWTSPTAAIVDGKAQIIYGGGDGWLYGLNAKDGSLLWKFDCNPKKATPYKAGGGGQKSFIIGTPVVHENRCFIGVGQEPDDGPGVGHLWCVDITKKPKGKDKDLSPVGDDFDPKSKANADSGLVWHYGGMVVPKPKNDDDRVWVFGRTMSTVAVHDGIVYAAELVGYLHALDAKTGKKLWEHDFTEDTWCSPYYVDGRVYLGTNSGDLYTFKAGKTYAPPKKVTIGQPVKVPVVVANGVLYINAGSTLYAIKK
jgi:outer membrane protein assembly factor BamB